MKHTFSLKAVIYLSLFRISSMLESKEIGLWFEHSNLESSLHVGVVLFCFRN